MHTFLLLASADRLPAELLGRIAERSVPRLTFESQSKLEWSSDSGRCAVLGWQANTHLGRLGSHWETGDGELTTFTGWPIPRTGGWSRNRSWAAQLAEWLLHSSPHSAFERLGGVYSLLHLDRRGRGFVTSDPFGVGPTYIGRRGSLTAVSSRADLVAAALASNSPDPPPRDLEGAGWLPFFGLVVGERTGFEGVETIPQGSYAEIKDGEVVVRRWTEAIWGPPEGSDETDLNGHLDQVLDELKANMESIGAVEAPERLVMLSGGKDSRLILALALATGSTEALSFRTVGLDTQADVAVARRLARELKLDLDHSLPGAVWLDPELLERRLRAHAFQTSGMLGAWDLQGVAMVSPSLKTNGLFGELMRSHYAAREEVRTPDDVHDFFAKRLYLDPAGILRNDAREHYRGQVRSWVDRRLAAGVAPADIADLFYLEHRMRRWVGAGYEGNQATPIFHPLQGTAALRTAVLAGHERRRFDHLHFELVRRCQPRLLEIPLANDTWPQYNYERGPATASLGPLAPQSGSPGPGSWQAANWKTIEASLEALAEAPSNPIFEVVDHERFRRAVRGSRELPLPGKVCLVATLGAGLWLAGEEEALRYPTVDPESPGKRADRLRRENRQLRRRVLFLETVLFDRPSPGAPASAPKTAASTPGTAPSPPTAPSPRVARRLAPSRAKARVPRRLYGPLRRWVVARRDQAARRGWWRTARLLTTAGRMLESITRRPPRPPRSG